MKNSSRLQLQAEKLCHEVFDVVQRFPKSQQFLFGKRISARVLDSLDGIVQAQYSSKQQQLELLTQVDMNLYRLRVLLRLATDRKLLSIGQLEHILKQIMVCGAMVGKWKSYLFA